MKKLIILLGVVGASLSAIFVRLSTAPALVLVFYRMLFSVAVLAPWSVLRCREEWKQTTRREVLLSLLSGVFLGFHFTLYFSSLRYTSIAASVVLVDTEVFFVALATPLILRRKITRNGWLGIGLTFLGSVIIALAGRGSAMAMRGNLLALGGAVCVAVYTMLGTVVRRTRSTTVYTTLVYAAGTATVALMLLGTGTPILGYGAADYGAGLGLCVFSTLLGHSVFSWGLKYESPAFVSTAKLMEPVFATLLGLALFREVPSVLVVLGGLLVIGGIAWYSFRGEPAEPASGAGAAG